MNNGLEERVARIEGILEQMADRLNHMDERLNHVETEMTDLRKEMRWIWVTMLAILIPMWVTIMLTVLFKG
ncbi:MAG: hypothetical protein ACE5KJ_06895 [Candidatus Zixiibacteriota bacterium]